jgi:hypothetical protein
LAKAQMVIQINNQILEREREYEARQKALKQKALRDAWSEQDQIKKRQAVADRKYYSLLV